MPKSAIRSVKYCTACAPENAEDCSNGRIPFRNFLFRSSRSSRVGPEAGADLGAGPEVGRGKASPLVEFITVKADGMTDVCCGVDEND